MFFACSNEEKNKPKQQRVHALVLSLWYLRSSLISMTRTLNQGTIRLMFYHNAAAAAAGIKHVFQFDLKSSSLKIVFGLDIFYKLFMLLHNPLLFKNDIYKH
jgi:hypothetical protein